MSMTSNNWYNVTFQWRIQDFPGESIIWHNVCRKQHENKKIALRGGELPSLPQIHQYIPIDIIKQQKNNNSEAVFNFLGVQEQ